MVVWMVVARRRLMVRVRVNFGLVWTSAVGVRETIGLGWTSGVGVRVGIGVWTSGVSIRVTDGFIKEQGCVCGRGVGLCHLPHAAWVH